MALNERARQEMYDASEQKVGKEAALTLLEYLPPIGWGDVATKEYVDHKFEVAERKVDRRFDALESKFDAKFEALESKFDGNFEASELRMDSMENRIMRLVEEKLRTQLLALAGLYAASIVTVLTITRVLK